jgi:hypothetical protein
VAWSLDTVNAVLRPQNLRNCEMGVVEILKNIFIFNYLLGDVKFCRSAEILCRRGNTQE